MHRTGRVKTLRATSIEAAPALKKSVESWISAKFNIPLHIF